MTFALVILLIVTVWCGFALWFGLRRSCTPRVFVLLAWGAFVFGVLIMASHGQAREAYIVLGLGAAAVLLWWLRIKPSNDRVWADDVARMTTGSVTGREVTLHNVRNFDWRTTTDYTQRWETRSYDLERLCSLDMILSHWSMRSIAHVLMSFGFEDGAHVVFSVEIRRERDESFSEIGGFFKEFELSIIAADERDVIRVRTNVRGEDDYLYRIRMPADMTRSLFLAYIDQANRLVHEPRFYNTITVNCTTLVYHMMRRIAGGLPISFRLLFSGYLPEYLYRVGGLDMRYPLAKLREMGRITDRARAADRSPHFSAEIRDGVPRLASPRA